MTSDDIKEVVYVLLDVKTTLESVLFDEQTIEANLWRGPMLPRQIATIDELLNRSHFKQVIDAMHAKALTDYPIIVANANPH